MADAVERLRDMTEPTPTPTPIRSILVTGAAKGIGRASVARLERHGFRVFAGVRTEADAQLLRAESVTPVMLDVTDGNCVARAMEVVESAVGGGGLQGLVNNAGIVVGGPMEGIPLDVLRHQFEVNLFGVVAVTQAALPLLRVGSGRIVNVSSINGRIVAPFVAPYAASKFALEAISDGFRMELQRWNIPVTVIEPGAVATPIWETSARRAVEVSERLPESVRTLYAGVLKRIGDRGRPPAHAVAPERVAAVIERALTVRRPAPRYLVGRDAKIAALLRLVLPDRLMDRVLTRRRRSRR